MRTSCATSSCGGSSRHTTTPRNDRLPSCVRASGRRSTALVLEIEVLGIESVPSGGPTAVDTEELSALALSSAGIDDGHVAVEFVDAERIRDLNRDHRGVDTPTDVLSFGVDEDGAAVGPRELGDIVICPQHTEDLREAIVHG